MMFWRRPGLEGRLRWLRGAGLTDLAPPTHVFEVPEMDLDAFRTKIENMADSMTQSVDEATPGTLDNLINSWADRCIAETEAAYSTHIARSEHGRGDATARAQLTRDLWLRDLGRLLEIGLAVEATLTNLIEPTDEEAPDDGRG